MTRLDDRGENWVIYIEITSVRASLFWVPYIYFICWFIHSLRSIYGMLGRQNPIRYYLFQGGPKNRDMLANPCNECVWGWGPLSDRCAGCTEKDWEGLRKQKIVKGWAFLSAKAEVGNGGSLPVGGEHLGQVFSWEKFRIPCESQGSCFNYW